MPDAVAAWMETAQAALDASGAAIRPYFRIAVQPELKADASPVTLADRQAESILRQMLAARFPDHGLLGEEFPPVRENAKYVWVIDPIDGTRAFLTGRPSFCTLLALLEDGVPILGLIDQPVTRERWIGGRGLAATFRGELGGKIGCSTVTNLREAELSSTAPEMFMPEARRRFSHLQSKCRRTYWGGDAYGYGLLALGRVDVVAEYGLKPWDWAALVPVVAGAGGVVTDWQGNKLHLDSDGSVLAAANPTLHAAALAALGEAK